MTIVKWMYVQHTTVLVLQIRCSHFTHLNNAVFNILFWKILKLQTTRILQTIDVVNNYW